jgi:hypothetical protein
LKEKNRSDFDKQCLAVYDFCLSLLKQHEMMKIKFHSNHDMSHIPENQALPQEVLETAFVVILQC